jgi:hypothetical protein
LIVLSLLTVAGCDKGSKSEEDPSYSVITKVEGPVSASIGQEIHIKVTLEGNNGCAVSGELHEIVAGDSRTITGKINYQGTVCPMIMVYMISDYSFKSTTPGIYQLKFLKRDGSYINHSVTVN